MIKNSLAFLGTLFLTLLLVAALLFMGVFYDWAGIVTLPNGFRNAIQYLATQVVVTRANPPEIIVATVEWQNPLNALPSYTPMPPPTFTPEETSTPSPMPTFTPTPVPTLDPQVYETESLDRMQSFANALQNWIKANNDLAANNQLLHDSTWREQMKGIQDEIQITSQALADIGPPPEQYQSITGWFMRVQIEAKGLVDHYSKALQSGDQGEFLAAGQQFVQLKEDLAQVVIAMQTAGWNLK